MTQNIERDGPGRRRTDVDCDRHERELEQAQKDLTVQAAIVAKTSGRFMAMLWFIGIAGSIIGGCMIILVTKTSAIETLLSDNRVSLMQHTEQLKNQDARIRDIEERNKYIDQQSGLLGGMRNAVPSTTPH